MKHLKQVTFLKYLLMQVVYSFKKAIVLYFYLAHKSRHQQTVEELSYGNFYDPKDRQQF